MRFLVTGAGGFIGSHLVERLINDGHHVIALVSTRFSMTNSRARAILSNPLVKVVEADLTIKESLVGLADGVEGVFHCAGIARPGPMSLEAYLAANCHGTQNLLTECLRAKVQKVIVLSSVAAVGPMGERAQMDEVSVPNPIDDYGKSKLAQERVAREFFKNKGLPIVILRPTTVYGSRDKEFQKIVKAVRSRFFPIRSNNKCIEYLHVHNLVHACLLVFEKAMPGEIFLVRDPKLYSLNEILQTVADILDVRLWPIYVTPRVFSAVGRLSEGIAKIFRLQPLFKASSAEWMTMKYWNINISKIEMLGYRPSVGLYEGVAEAIKAK